MARTVVSARVRTILVSIVILTLATVVGATALPVGAQSGDSGEIEIEVVEGTVATGEEITIEATLNGEPVTNGTVSVESGSDELETTTDEAGQATFVIPDGDFVEVNVVDESENAFGERQLIGDDQDDGDESPDDSGEIEIEIVEGTVAVGEEITIEARIDGDPIANAGVFVESDSDVSETTTNENGRVSFTIPDSDYVSVTVEAEDSNAFGRQQLIGDASEGPSEPPAEEGPGVKGEIRIDVLNDQISRGEETTIQATLNGEPLTNASVGVGTGSGEPDVETETDENGQATFVVPDTEDVVVVVQDDSSDAFGEKQLFGEPDSGAPGESDLNISVIETSITHVGGPAPDEEPAVDAFVAFNLLQIQLKTAPDAGLDGRDLSGIGVTKDTEFEITVTTTSFDPRLMIGTGNDVSWDYSVGENSTEITITTKPASQQLILPDEGETPRIGNWPEGDGDQATTGRDVTADFAIDSLASPGQQELQGGYIVTDAQAFSTPVYSPPRPSQSPELQIDIAGPHLTINGSENDGFYRAKLPDSLLTAWNVSDPSDLSAAYKGSEKNFDTTDVDDGLVVELDIDYSSGTVQLGTTLNGSEDNATTGPGDLPERLASFTDTSDPGEVDSNSLSGKIRAETTVAEDVEVELLRNTPTNYSLAITAPNGTENVTFYLQSQAIESSQDIDNVTMYLDSEQRDFYVDEDAGPGQSPWVGFEVDEFSTRTVTFTSASTSDNEMADDSTYGISGVMLDPSTVDTNTTVDHDLSYTVTAASNDGNSDTHTITLPNTTTIDGANNLTVTDATGEEILISSSASLADANGGTNNQLTFGVQPDSALDTSEVTVEANVTVEFPEVSEETNGDINISISDSTNGDTDTTTQVTIQPPGQAPVITGDSPARDLDGDGLYEDINGDGEFNIVDVNALFQNRESGAVQNNGDLFDFTGDGNVNIIDVSRLLQDLSATNG
jgi:uncharacterized GH25 family protein